MPSREQESNVKCRFCGSDSVRPSRFRRFDWLLRLLLLQPVRCRDCYRRYYRISL